jgi:hypothetical protein
MATLEIIALDESAPQLRAPASGDSYKANRKIAIAPEANGNALVVSGFSLTGANAYSLADLAGTWNTTGAPTALKLDILDSASDAASLLCDLRVDGASKFNVAKTGAVTVTGQIDLVPGSPGNGLKYDAGLCNNLGGHSYVRLGSSAVALGSEVALAWTGSAAVEGAPTIDTSLYRDAANVLALRNGASPQALNIYNTCTDSSNYERGFARWNANNLEIGTEKAGTGSVRNMVLNTGDQVIVQRQGVQSYTFSSSTLYGGGKGLGTNTQRWTNLYQSGFHLFGKMTPPATPSANDCCIYARDNGGGKTQLVVLMPDGVETVLATQT